MTEVSQIIEAPLTHPQESEAYIQKKTPPPSYTPAIDITSTRVC